MYCDSIVILYGSVSDIMTQGHNEDTYYVIKSGEVNVYQAQAAQVQFPHTCTECIPHAEVIARIITSMNNFRIYCENHRGSDADDTQLLCFCNL